VTRRRRPSAPPASRAAPTISRAAPPSGALAAILFLALGLRLWHLGEGLPDFFEEAFPHRRAFEMAGWGTGRVDWNPHAFHYPSLTFYLHMALQWIQYALGRVAGAYRTPADFYVAYQVDPTSMAMAARGLGVVADLATIVAVACVAERLRRGAGLLAALLLAVCATLIHQAHAIVTDGIMAALAAWALERMVAYRMSGRPRALASAAVLIGLATGAKYPAALLAAPLAWAVLARREGRRGPRLALALGAAALVFIATTPWLFAEAAQVRFDWLRMANLVGAGGLGASGRPGAFFALGLLARDFGWLAPVALAASLAELARRPPGFHDRILAWVFLLAFLAPVAIARAEFERYLAPIAPAVAVILALTALGLPDAWPRLDDRGRAWMRSLLVLALTLPACVAGFRAASVGGDTTEAEARRFVENRVGPDDILVQEAHGAPVVDRWEVNRVRSMPAYAAADSSWRRRFEQRRVLRSVRLPLLVAGKGVVVVADSARGGREIELFPSSADLNRVFYEPALYVGADWFLTSAAVRGRYEADSIRWAMPHRFYRLLEDAAERVVVLRSGGTVTGPEIRIYRLGDRFRAAIRDSLDPDWWTRDIPASARVELDAVMRAAPPLRSDLELPPTWVMGLGAMFERQIEPFLYDLALEVADVGRCDAALPLARALLRMDPGQLQATGLAVTCDEAEGRLVAARDAIARFLAVRDPEGRGMHDIRLEYVRLLAQTGARDEARRQLARVLSSPRLDGDVQRRAHALMDALERGPVP
jgi:Dolichyl-phosphate-mannose-protein mannosyltransferase